MPKRHELPAAQTGKYGSGSHAPHDTILHVVETMELRYERSNLA
jgi:hypothetical protein